MSEVGDGTVPEGAPDPPDDPGGAAAPLSAAHALRGGRELHLAGNVAAAIQTYERGLTDEAASASDRGLLRAWLASACFLAGDADRCRALAAEALADRARPARRPGRGRSAHVARARRGAGRRPQANATHYGRALEHAEAAGDLLQIARIRCNRGAQQLEEGEFEIARSTSSSTASGRRGRRSEASYFARDRAAQPRALRLGVGRLEDAADDLVLARAAFQHMGSRMAGPRWPTSATCIGSRATVRLARASYEEAVATAESVGDVQSLGFALAGLARVLVDDEPERAEEIVKRSIELGSVLSQQHALLAGRVGRARPTRPPRRPWPGPPRPAAIARARRDRVGGRRGDRWRRARRAGPAADVGPRDAREIWRRIGNPLGEAKADLALAQLGDGDVRRARRGRPRRRSARPVLAGWPASPGGLTDRGGPVASARDPHARRVPVLRRGEPMPTADWGSKKARDLLKILLSRRGQRVPRDVIIELLWPDEDPIRTAPRLSVVLSTLRARSTRTSRTTTIIRCGRSRCGLGRGSTASRSTSSGSWPRPHAGSPPTGPVARTRHGRRSPPPSPATRVTSSRRTRTRTGRAVCARRRATPTSPSRTRWRASPARSGTTTPPRATSTACSPATRTTNARTSR